MIRICSVKLADFGLTSAAVCSLRIGEGGGKGKKKKKFFAVTFTWKPALSKVGASSPTRPPLFVLKTRT